MTFDCDLIQLQKKTISKQRLETKLQNLRQQQQEFAQRAAQLRSIYRSEQKDVDKLEGRSLSNYFHLIFGDLESKLTEERRQAAAAKVKLDAAEKQLTEIQQEIEDLEKKLNPLQGCEEAYQAALEKKYSDLKSSQSPAAVNILKIEEKTSFFQCQKTELQEARAAGQNALATVEQILAELDRADGWNTWDILAGDGIITHIAKHSHLDHAQDLVEQLQKQLGKFKTELSDIELQADLQIKIDGFLRVADYCFDGLFADWAVGRRIGNAKSNVVSLKFQILTALKKLEEIDINLEKSIRAQQEKIKKIVIES